MCQHVNQCQSGVVFNGQVYCQALGVFARSGTIDCQYYILDHGLIPQFVIGITAFEGAMLALQRPPLKGGLPALMS